MKSALFVQANVAVNTKLTSKVPFLFGNFQVFLKKFGQKRAISVWYDGKIFLLLLLLKSLLSRVTTDMQLYKCQMPIYYS
jgi:hypothetical protein